MKNLLVVTLLLFSTVVFTTMARGQDFEFQNPQFQTLSMDNVKVVTINTMKVSEAPKTLQNQFVHENVFANVNGDARNKYIRAVMKVDEVGEPILFDEEPFYQFSKCDYTYDEVTGAYKHENCVLLGKGKYYSLDSMDEMFRGFYVNQKKMQNVMNVLVGLYLGSALYGKAVSACLKTSLLKQAATYCMKSKIVSFFAATPFFVGTSVPLYYLSGEVWDDQIHKYDFTDESQWMSVAPDNTAYVRDDPWLNDTTFKLENLLSVSVWAQAKEYCDTCMFHQRHL